MRTTEGYWLFTTDDLAWRPSNLMRIPNADYLEHTGSEKLGYPTDPTQLPKELAGKMWPPRDATRAEQADE